ncbi:DUF3592 domain-containing protein [Paraburkholderia phosphatilytica]|uniref:DUF3592 domain-containing protein n=1 Tax=Paraburkholderia phosphatilytica TaxID=2282883 RepID=UPI000E4E4FE6|nr:DUF3592 domain-containing protein [Paraburkholderia phosphatilytica]
MLKVIGAGVVGICLLIAAALNAQSTREFIRESILVPGEVVRLNAGGSHPQVDFVTKAGEHVSSPQGGMIWGMKVGQAVEVRYLAEDPLPTATLNRFGTIWGLTVFLAAMGFGFIVAGLCNLPRG